MLMDLSCPAEFCSVEVLRDSGGRAQAYLTFLNLSDRTLTEIAAMVTMLDADGVSLGMRPLRYHHLTAMPHAQFTLCMVLDDLPFFQNARVTIQRVAFEEGEPWAWDEDALLDCTPKELAPGPQRVALVAVAGTDAICWPERRRDAWVCVCGRFNLPDWTQCKRCRRDREDTFARYELNAVMAQYQRQINEEIHAERQAREMAVAEDQEIQSRRQEDFGQKLQLARSRRRALWLALLAAALIAVGVIGLIRDNAGKQTEQGAQSESTAVPTVHEPLG